MNERTPRPPNRKPAKRTAVPVESKPSASPKHDADSNDIAFDLDTPLKTSPGPTTWVVVLLLCGLMFATFWLVRPVVAGQKSFSQVVEDGRTAFFTLFAAEENDSVEPAQAIEKKAKRQKKKRRRKRARNSKRSRRNQQTDSVEETYDDIPLGDIFTEREHADWDEEPNVTAEDIPVVIPKRLYDPSPSYRPSSRFQRRGYRPNNTVTLDLGSGSGAGAGANGTLSASQIEAGLDEKQLTSCYRDAVQKVPHMRGRVHLTIDVENSGRVGRVVVTRSDLHSKQVEDCIVKRAKQFRFPTKTGGATTRFDTDFSFSSR